MKKTNLFLILGIILIIGSINVFGDNLTDGLIVYYNYNNNYTDSLNTYNSTNVGTVLQLGLIGNGVYFNGSTYITTTISVTANTTSLWFKALASSRDNDVIFSQRTSDTNGYRFGKKSTSNNLTLKVGSTEYNINQDYFNNTWHHLIITRNGSTNTLVYLDSVLKLSTPVWTTVGNIRFGDEYNGVYFYVGMIDEVAIYNRQLNLSEIQQLYNNGTGLTYPFIPVTTNFTITNINVFNSQYIYNFSALINGITYNTTTGTITTNLLSNATSLYNITIISNNMFNKTYINYNVSTNLNANQDQYPILYLINAWNNSNITVSNITINNINYGSTTNLIYIPLNSSYNVTTNINNYYNITQLKNLSQNTLNNISVYQSDIVLQVKEFDSNITLSNYTVNITGYNTLINVTGNNKTIYPNANTYNITRITDNTGQEIYQLVTNNFTINALDNKTVTLYVYEHIINVTAKNIRTNATINNFTITLTDLTDGSDTRTFNTTTGYIDIPVIHHNYTLTIDGNNFALYNNTVNYSVSSNINHTFYLYTTNSFDIKFYDEITKALLSTRNITLEAISDVYANNYSTSNGTLYIDLLTPDTYLLRYKSLPDYAERTYTIVLSNRTYNQLNLYLVNGSQTITLNVKDQDDNNIKEAYVKVLRYDLTTNSYTVREIITTDISGNGYFQGILNTEFYKFIVEYPLGDEKLSTSADYLRSTTLTLRINTQEDTLNNYFTSIQTYATMTFNNATNTFTYYYNDATNTLSQGCLYIYRTINAQTTLTNSSCNSGSSGTITLGVVNGSGYYYNAQGTVLIDDKEYLVASKDKYFNKFNEKDSKNNFLFLTILLTLAMSLLFLWNITIALILTPIPLVFMSFADLIPVSRGVTITIALIGLTLAFMISKRS